tara:strand:+ start:255 stop:647 length:393 start_codon:yes stop_codon:yes gene_type:complete
MINKNTDPTCEDRITESIISRGEDFKRFMNAEDEKTQEEFYNYGLCLDMVSVGTFKDQKEPYLRYQISFGGPSEELRFYQNGTVEFWFLDWYDGAHKIITSLDWVQWLKEYLEEIELLTNEEFFKGWEVE